MVKLKLVLLSFVFFSNTLLFCQEQAKEKEQVQTTEAKEADKKQQAKKNEKPEEKKKAIDLDKDVISSLKLKQTSFDSTISTTVIDKNKMKEDAPRTSADALMFQPGIWVQNTGRSGTPIIRGFMGNQVLYLFDSVRVNTVGVPSGPNGSLWTVDALDMDRVEVIRGPGSVLYGSDAIGGVVNVITNETPIYSDSKHFGGRIYGRYASADQEKSGRAEAYYSNEKLFVFAGLTNRDMDDLSSGRGGKVQKPSGSTENNWDAQVDFKITENHELEAFVQNYDRPKSTRFDTPFNGSSTERQLYGLKYRGTEMGFIDKLEVYPFYHKQTSYSFKKDATGKKTSDGVSEDVILGLDVTANSSAFDILNFAYGVHFHRDTLKAEERLKKTHEADVTAQNPAVFLLTEYTPFEKLKIDLGLRLDQFNFKSTAPALKDMDKSIQAAVNSGSLSLSNLNLDNSDTAFTGGLGVEYLLTDNWNITAHLGRAFRAPNKSDLLSFGEFTLGFGVPTANVKPESSWSFELATKAEYENFTGALTAYYTIVEDGIVRVKGTFNGQSWLDVNGNGVEDLKETVYVRANTNKKIVAYGLDYQSNWYLPQNWTEFLFKDNFVSVYSNFSVIGGKNEESKEPLDRGFPVNALIGVRVENSRNAEERKWWGAAEIWMVNDYHKIPASRFTRDAAFFNNPQDDKSGTIRPDGLPGFGIVNLKGGVKIMKNTMATIMIQNVGDKLYRVKDSRIDSPGLNMVLGLNVVF